MEQYHIRSQTSIGISTPNEVYQNGAIEYHSTELLRAAAEKRRIENKNTSCTVCIG